MPNIQLTRQHFPTWQKLGEGHFAGQVWTNGAWLSNDQINEILEPVQSAPELAKILENWNGSFALIWSVADTTFMACDIARSIPLFWQVDTEAVNIKDRLAADDGIATVWQQEEILVQSEFVPGHASLRYGWQQLQAGELLEIKGRMCYLNTYFDHRRPAPMETSESELKLHLTGLIQAQTQRLISWADGRTIVVPLSGGYDSRLVLAAIHQQKYPHLKAFTYGQADSWEVQLAKKTATQLGIDWQFVAYTPELLERFGSENWVQYADYAANMCSIPQDQDYFALAYLRESGWLEADSIICPGYCGDVQAGSYLPGNYFKLPWRRTGALQEYLYHRFVRYPSDRQKNLWQPVLPQAPLSSEEEVISELENWVLREYMTKFIINGVRAYEWFECAWYLPLWDLEFIRYWQKVPNQYREGMRLYREVLAAEYFEPLGITFSEDKLAPNETQWLKDMLPLGTQRQLKDAIKPTSSTQDINGLHLLIPKIQDILGWPQHDLSKSLNEMLGHWYLRHVNTKDQAKAEDDLSTL